MLMSSFRLNGLSDNDYHSTELSRPTCGKLEKAKVLPVEGDTLLHEAVRYGNIKEVEKLLSQGDYLVQSVNAEGESPLHVAIISGNLEVCKLLLKSEADPDIRYHEGSTGLLVAIESGHLELVNLLLNYGADANKEHAFKNYSPLEVAVTVGHEDIVESLLHHGAEANARASATLHMAVNGGHVNIVRLLLQFKADPSSRLNCTYYRYKSPLHIAVRKGFMDLVGLLLKFGANPNAKDYKDTTPLHLAAQIGNAHLVSMLIHAGAIIDSKNSANQTPLHVAVNHQECFKLLLSYGADVNIGDNSRGSPLHVFAEMHSALDDCHKFVSLVSKYGGNISMKCNISKQTPLSIACHKGATRLILVLLEHGCDVDLETAFDDLPNVRSIREVFLSQLIKMNACKIFLSPHYVDFVKKGNFLEFQEECEKEISLMKVNKIGSSNISFYDMLTKPLDSQVRFAQNDEVTNIMGTRTWKHNYPIYSNIILNNYEGGVSRRRLLCSTEINLEKVLIMFRVLPHVCRHTILSYLTNRDMVAFLVAIYSKVDLE